MANRSHITLYDRYLASRLLITLLKVIVSLVLLFVLFDFLSRQESIFKRDAPLSAVALYYLCLVPSILFTFQVAAMSPFGATQSDHHQIAMMLAHVANERLFLAQPAALLLSVDE